MLAIGNGVAAIAGPERVLRHAHHRGLGTGVSGKTNG